MNVALLYLLLLKGTCTAFAGLASLPVIHDTLVTQHGVLTEEQLNQAVVVTRSSPGFAPERGLTTQGSEVYDNWLTRIIALVLRIIVVIIPVFLFQLQYTLARGVPEPFVLAMTAA